MKKSVFLLFVMCFVGLFMACNASKSSTSTDERIKNLEAVDNIQTNMTLADHLRRLPGVSVRGNGQNVDVTMKGIKSMTATAEPLYVVGGQRYQSYAAVAGVVDVNDIKSVRVVRDVNERAEYGMAGAQGVIVITLKK